uniref:Uncharacterized protein n=1 Tax=Arundo donax TaxID=35708 RepID=A0A0A8XYB7_ARUDO
MPMPPSPWRAAPQASHTRSPLWPESSPASSLSHSPCAPCSSDSKS